MFPKFIQVGLYSGGVYMKGLIFGMLIGLDRIIGRDRINTGGSVLTGFI